MSVKVIDGFPDYTISTNGDVTNKSGTVLKQKITKTGYKTICLYNEGKRKYPRINRLVALHFIDNPNNYPTVDHIDKNKLNNDISNLRWANNSQQQYNKNKKEGCSSKYKGVSKNESKKNWQVGMYINGKSKNIGTFNCEIDAAKAYNDAVIQNNLQEFAVLNKIPKKITIIRK